jgi:hypothetical protein
MNIHRRSLSADQRGVIWNKAADVMSAMARAKQKAAGIHGSEGGRGRKKPLLPNDSKGSEPESRARNARSTAGQLATGAGISQRKAAEVLAVKKHAPELADDVARGKVKLKVAAKVARERAAEEKPPRKTKPRKPRPVDLEKVLRREVAHFEKTRDSLPKDMRPQFCREFIRTLERL